MIIKFLLSMLEFGDILTTARVITKHTTMAMAYVRMQLTTVDWAEAFTGAMNVLVDGLDSLTGVTGKLVPDVPGAGTAASVLSGVMFLPGLIMKGIGAIVSAVLGALSVSLPDVLSHLNVYDQYRAQVEAAVASGNLGDVISIAKTALAAVGPAFGTAMNLAAGGVDAFLGLIDGLFTARINIPVLTWLYENIICPGCTLNLLSVLSLFVAAPFTLLWKLVNGGSAPFGGSDLAMMDGLGVSGYGDFLLGRPIKSEVAVRHRRNGHDEDDGSSDGQARFMRIFSKSLAITMSTVLQYMGKGLSGNAKEAYTVMTVWEHLFRMPFMWAGEVEKSNLWSHTQLLWYSMFVVKAYDMFTLGHGELLQGKMWSFVGLARAAVTTWFWTFLPGNLDDGQTKGATARAFLEGRLTFSMITAIGHFSKGVYLLTDQDAAKELSANLLSRVRPVIMVYLLGVVIVDEA